MPNISPAQFTISTAAIVSYLRNEHCPICRILTKQPTCENAIARTSHGQLCALSYKIRCFGYLNDQKLPYRIQERFAVFLTTAAEKATTGIILGTLLVRSVCNGRRKLVRESDSRHFSNRLSTLIVLLLIYSAIDFGRCFTI